MAGNSKEHTKQTNLTTRVIRIYLDMQLDDVKPKSPKPKSEATAIRRQLEIHDYGYYSACPVEKDRLNLLDRFFLCGSMSCYFCSPNQILAT
mmetsp:Transcript_31436/g.65762  ORF Transcript_31436/g.65762 Transcript_31436/m.65762 type:complete len:92 (-) Transcript_31436:97-372(-)